MNQKTQMVIEFMHMNLHRKLSLDELARSARISRSHVSRLFKTETGMAPGQYLQTLRMKKASTLLTTTLLSIKWILIEVGYCDKGLFSGHFKRAHGVTPSEYRATCHDLLAKDHTAARHARMAG